MMSAHALTRCGPMHLWELTDAHRIRQESVLPVPLRVPVKSWFSAVALLSVLATRSSFRSLRMLLLILPRLLTTLATRIHRSISQRPECSLERGCTGRMSLILAR